MAVTEAGHGASRALDDLYRRHGGEVYRYALAVLGNHADAEDVTQTTFLNAYRSLEQGVKPRKPSNWLLTIASNLIKQRFRQEVGRPRQVAFDDDRLAQTDADDVVPTVGEVLTALSRIPPQQRQAVVLREFEGRSYQEIAAILGVTTSALETLLFRARTSLAEELEQHLTCTDAQLAVSRAADERLGRKERRRLREHLAECPDCSRFARAQQRNRRALRGLMLVPVPLSFTLFRGLEGSAAAATLPAVGVGAGAGATALAGSSVGAVTAGAAGAGVGGGLAVKAAAVVAAAGVAGGVGVVGASEVDTRPGKTTIQAEKPGQRVGKTAPRGVLVPGRGVARGKSEAPGRVKAAGTRATGKATGKSSAGSSPGKAAQAPGKMRAQGTAARQKARDSDAAEGNGVRSTSPSSLQKPKKTTRARGQSKGAVEAKTERARGPKTLAPP